MDLRWTKAKPKIKEAKTNVISMSKWDDYKAPSEHEQTVYEFNSVNPHTYILQTHLNNLRATYGDHTVMEAITLLGLHKADKVS